MFVPDEIWVTANFKEIQLDHMWPGQPVTLEDLPREDRWQTLARMALRYDLYAALAALTGEVLNATAPDGDAEARVDEWEQSNATSIARTRNAIGEFGESPGDLAALSVLLRQIRTLVRASAA